MEEPLTQLPIQEEEVWDLFLLPTLAGGLGQEFFNQLHLITPALGKPGVEFLALLYFLKPSYAIQIQCPNV